MGSPRLRGSRRAFLRGAAVTGGGLLAAAIVGCDDGGAARVPLALDTHPRADADPSGILRLGLPGEAQDPAPVALIAATLLSIDPRNRRISAGLAREVEWRPEELRLALKLHPGAQFHADIEGQQTRVSADAVRLDFERRAAADEFLAAQVIDSIETPNRDTVVLRLAAPFSVLFEALSDPVQASIWRMDRAGRPVLGSGPFVPAERPPAPGVFRLDRHTGYHLSGYPRLTAIDLIRGAGGAPAQWADSRLDVSLVEPGGAAPPIPAGAALQSRPSRAVRGLGFSLIPVKDGAEVRHIAAMQDPRVRLAAAHALDRDALLAIDGSVLAGPVGPAHGGDRLSEDELRGHAVYRHDPGEARALLAAAGVEDLVVRIDAPNNPVMRELGRLIEAQLRQAGFAPQLQLLAEEEYDRVLTAGNFEAILFEAPAAATVDFGLRLHGSAGVGGGFSPWGYSNPVYDSAVAEVLRAATPTERAERSRAAQRLLLDDIPAMFPLGAPPRYALVGEGVTGFHFDAYEHNDGWLSSGWQRETPADTTG